MHINPEHIISSFEKGETITLDNPKTLTEVEDVLADRFLPLPSARPGTIEAARISWDHRMPLDEALRNGRFNGRLLDVSLEPIEKPYDELIAVRAVYGKRTIAQHAVGFVVHAALSSTASLQNGELHRPVWLLPRTPQMLDKGLWQRVIGPVFGQDDIERLHRDSVSRGRQFGYTDTGPRWARGRKPTLSDGSEKTG